MLSAEWLELIYTNDNNPNNPKTLKKPKKYHKKTNANPKRQYSLSCCWLFAELLKIVKKHATILFLVRFVQIKLTYAHKDGYIAAIFMVYYHYFLQIVHKKFVIFKGFVKIYCYFLNYRNKKALLCYLPTWNLRCKFVSLELL